MNETICQRCKQPYSFPRPCACAWRKEHYRLMQELDRLDRSPTQSEEKQAYRREVVAALKANGEDL